MAIKNNKFTMENGEILLGLYDRHVITKKRLEKLIHMNFETGEMEKEYWDKEWVGGYGTISWFLLKLFDKNLISKEILAKNIIEEEN